jgi:ferric-dicitrate binding protein FerR (iron transport regulator)
MARDDEHSSKITSQGQEKFFFHVLVSVPARWVTGLIRCLRAAPVVHIAVLVTLALVVSAALHLRSTGESGDLPTPLYYSTEFAEHRQEKLPDGSLADLNTSTKLKVWMLPHMRLVEVLEGEARFIVQPDASRPFRAISGTLISEALGTIFTVYRTAHQESRLVVIEGSVLASRRIPGVSRTNQLLGEYTAGQRIDAPDDLQMPPRLRLGLSPHDLSSATAWVQGRIDFNGRSLQEATEEVSRYNHVRFIFLDPRLATAYSLGGLVITTDLEDFLSMLRRLCTIEADMPDSGTRIIEVSSCSNNGAPTPQDKR